MIRCLTYFCLSVLADLLFGYTAIHASATNSGSTESACVGKRLQSLENNNPDIACAILIDDDLVFPRNVIAVGEDIWLIDKGSNLFKNGEHKGAIYHYRKLTNGYVRTRVLTDLDDPNVFVGMQTGIIGFTLQLEIKFSDLSPPLLFQKLICKR